MKLSIVVLSYNRPEQIKRILENLVGALSGDFNLIIKDDCSPKNKEIVNIVEHYKSLLNFSVKVYSNPDNLGYDRNLIDAFKVVDSEYVFLLSDDDYLNGRELSSLLVFLDKCSEKVIFTPYTEDGAIKRYKKISDVTCQMHNVIYNSILFSGLIFHRSSVLDLTLDYEFLNNCIYSQVYIASIIIYHQKSVGFAPTGLLLLGGDGENFFGKNKSSKNSELISDRKSIFANLNYQKFLLNVVEKIAVDSSLQVSKQFIKEYDKRLLAYLIKARSQSIADYIAFIKVLYRHSRRPVHIFLLTPFLLILPSYALKKVYTVLKNKFRHSG